MRAMVIRSRCIGCGLCARTCPAVFEIDDRERARAANKLIFTEHESACREAFALCPVEAIRIVADPAMVT